jgi:hypothetical protein
MGRNKGNYWTLDPSNGDGTYKQRPAKRAKRGDITHPVMQDNGGIRSPRRYLMSSNLDEGITSRSRILSSESDTESVGTLTSTRSSLGSQDSPLLVEDSLVPVELSPMQTIDVSLLLADYYSDITPRRQSETGSSFPPYYTRAIRMISPLDGVRLPPLMGGNDTGAFSSSFDVNLPPLRDVMRGIPSVPGHHLHPDDEYALPSVA